MPTKINGGGKQQEYVPKGNGDASGEYADANGGNIHFAVFAQPLPKNFNTSKTTLKTPKATTQKSANNTNAPKPTKAQTKAQQIKATLEAFNKKTVKGKEDGYNDLKLGDMVKTGTKYPIDKALAAFGFNGLPQVVDKDVFDAAVKESKFVAVRGIGASSKTQLDDYIDQLYKGDFYVSCKNGGAQYGQGMYCAATYGGGPISQGAISEAQGYVNRHTWSSGSAGKIVHITMGKDAKIIKHTDLISEFQKKVKSDPKAVEFVARSVFAKYGASGNTKTAVQNDYDSLTQQEKDYLMHEVEYRLTGDVKNHTKLDRQATHDIPLNNRMLGRCKDALINAQASINRAAAISGSSGYTYDCIISRACDAIGVNDGILAASMGYDAINAENHGSSGSYTVILNRSKCLFLKD